LGALICGLPASLFGGDHPHTGVQAAIMAIELAIFAIVGVAGLVDGWRCTRSGTDDFYEPNTYALVHGTAYLAVFAFLWVTALPAWFAATNGVTSTGTLTGSLPYAIFAFAGAGTAIGLLATAGRPVRRGAEAAKPLRASATAI